MTFNPDTTKQYHEVIFSGKQKKVHPLLLFNNAIATRTFSPNHLGIMLDTQLKFEDHLKMVSGKIIKTIGFLCKL